METFFKFDSPIFIHLIWLMIAILIISIILIIRKKKMLQLLVSESNFHSLANTFSTPRQIVKLSFKIIGLLLLIFAIMRPVGFPEELRVKGRDIVFILDVSKSMLAEDEGLKTSRLDRAKIAISDVTDILDGDRVALVVFAGATVLKCPLTNDYYFFKSILKRTSVIDVNRGGTLIGDAIRFVDKNILSDSTTEELRYKDIILITDGEDQDSFPVEAAKSVVEKGISIHTVGIGSIEGSKIPIKDKEGNITGFVKQTQGSDDAHRSTLNEETLKQIALITNGIYIPARTNVFYLADLYRQRIATEEQKETRVKNLTKWEEMYQIFLLGSILMFIISFLVPERKFAKNIASEISKPNVAMLFMIIPITLFFTNCADKPYTLVEDGNKLYMEDKIEDAKIKYHSAEEMLEDSEVVKYNTAMTDYLEDNLEQATEKFNELTNSKNDAIRKKATTGLGNVYMKQADKVVEQNPQQAYQLYSKSIEQFRKVIEEESKSIIPQSDKAITEKELENAKILKEAYNNLERAIIKRNKLKQDNQKQDNQKQNENQDEKNQQQNNQQQNNSNQQNQQDNQQQNDQQQNNNNNQNQQNDQQQSKEQKQNKENKEQKEANQQLSSEEARELLEKMRAENEDVEKEIQKQLYKFNEIYVEKDW